jgi:hypothetical protein
MRYQSYYNTLVHYGRQCHSATWRLWVSKSCIAYVQTRLSKDRRIAMFNIARV